MKTEKDAEEMNVHVRFLFSEDFLLGFLFFVRAGRVASK